MTSSLWRSRVAILCSRNIKNPILPVTRLCFSISESVHTKPLPPSLMPCSFIPMSISKLIDSKTMHLICKIFPSIHVPVSAYKEQWSQVVIFLKYKLVIALKQYNSGGSMFNCKQLNKVTDQSITLITKLFFILIFQHHFMERTGFRKKMNL